MDDSSTVEPSLSSGDPAWQFAVGGYEVVRKWLRAQRGEAVTRQAAADFRHMVEVIRETAEIQGNLGSLQFDASEGFDYR